MALTSRMVSQPDMMSATGGVDAVSFAEALEVLFEDNHCIAVVKPAGWPTTHFDGKEETFDRVVKAYLKEKYQKPGEVFLGVVQRLDKPVTGVLLFARTSKSASRLAEQFRTGGVEKVYWAVVPGRLAAPAGTFEDWLLKDDAAARVTVVPGPAPGAQHAVLHYSVLTSAGDLSLLELRPQTGRKHQLRVQLAHRGFPIYGDVRYGSVKKLGPAIALHARSLTFLHPIRHEPVTVQAATPNHWRGRFAALLGAEGVR